MNTKADNSSGKFNAHIQLDGPQLPKIAVAVLFAIAWPAISLFNVSLGLCAGAVLITAYTTFLFLAAGALNLRNKTLIRALLLSAVMLTALVGLLTFQLQMIRFFVVDGTVLVLFLTSLALGLWSLLFAWQKYTAAITAIMLVVAPFTPDVEENDKWSISLKVVNETCEPLPLASAVCEAVAVESLKDFMIQEHTGLSLTDSAGKAKFEMAGNPLLKGAVCGAFRVGTDATKDPTFSPQSVLVPAPFFSKAKAQLQLSRSENQIPPQDCNEGE